MKKYIALALLATTVSGCMQATQTVAPTMTMSTVTTIPGKVSVQVENYAQVQQTIKPSTYVGSAWDFPIDTSGVERSLVSSIQSSYSGYGQMNHVKLTINDIQPRLQIVQGPFTNQVQTNVELEIRVSKNRHSRTIYASRRGEQTYYEYQVMEGVSSAFDNAFKMATRKAVVQATEFLENS